MRVLITGASGFVGPYLFDSLRRVSANATVILTGKTAAVHAKAGRIDPLDVTDRAAVDQAIARYSPSSIVHLAGIAAPTAANADPEMAWRVHVQGTLNVANSILANAPDCTLIHVGSGLVYGTSARSGLPLDEATLLEPSDDYSATKAAADLALGAMVRRGLRCVRFRPFNHIGPGQDEAFVVPSFAMQIARIEAQLQPPVIRVGNLDAERDMLDVRDVTMAYAIAAQRARELPPRTILNVASGTAYRIGDLLERLIALSNVPITVERDPARMRPADLPTIVGDASLARELLGWAPEYRFDQTLAEILAYCRNSVTGPAYR